MVVPREISLAARDGDAGSVLAWIDSGGDVNDADEVGQTLLYMTAMVRGRAKPRRTRTGDPVVTRTLRLPNELCWYVLKFWRATSDATGEVI